jgi:putative ABC transport system permease protein
MEMLLQDLRFALRTLYRNLAVTCLATGSLALAIAGNTAVYSLVNSFLYRPLPYTQADRLLFMCERSSDVTGGQISTTSAANYLDFAERQRSFKQTAAFRAASFNLESDGRPEQVAVGQVTPGFFSLLGVEPAWGRAFLDEEGVRGRDRVVMLSHGFWTERFGRTTDLAGQTLKLNGERFQIVGVLAEDFEWIMGTNTKIWVPLALERGAEPRQRRDLFGVARLADGATEKAAQTEINGLMSQLTQEHPGANRGYVIDLINLREEIPVSYVRMSLRMIQAALLFVLLIACANIANLLLSRSQAREREIAIRTSIGATRRRIMVQLFTESMVMALIAGVLGVALGYAGLKMLNYSLAGFLPAIWLPTLDLRVLLYSLGVTLLGGVLFGLAPVLQASRFDLVSSLKDGSQGATAGGRRRLASNLLVVAEISLALAFLAGASMMIRTFEVMQNTDPGFETSDLLVLRLNLPEDRYDSEEKLVTAVGQMKERLRAVPGVRGVMVSNLTPRTSFVPQATFEIRGRPPAAQDALPRAGWIAVSQGYLESLGVPLVQGRLFTPADDLDAPRVAVINEALAKRHWPEESPVGRRLTVHGEEHEVVGVVATVRHDMMTPTGETPLLYIAWEQRPTPAMRMAIKAGVEPATLADPARRELLALDPNLGLTDVETLDAFVKRTWVGQRVFAGLLAGFGALALLLAALGTYGVLAYSVAQRTQEIGIRMAVGASRGNVLGMVARQGLKLGVFGILVGIPLILAEIKVISAIFSGLVPVDSTALVGVAVALLLVALLASLVPARRAASIDPLRALRGG